MATLGRLSSKLSRNCLSVCRCFSQTPILTSKYSKTKQKQSLRKSEVLLSKRLDGKGDRKKKSWYDTPVGLSGAGGFGGTSRRGPSEGSKRRAHQLSVVLSQYIISIINSGELDPRLPEMGVEIIRVKMVSDLGALHVYWSATGSQQDDEIQTILAEASWKLRSMLTGLHLMNFLPPVVFIKDLSQARLEKVNRLLEQADMGPDYEPGQLGASLKSDLTLPHVQTLTPGDFQTRMEAVTLNLANTEVTNMDEVKDAPTLSPPQGQSSGDVNIKLRSDVYDLDHTALIHKVIQGKRAKVTRGPLFSTDADLNLTSTDLHTQPNDLGSGRLSDLQGSLGRLSKDEIQKMLRRQRNPGEKRNKMKQQLATETYKLTHGDNEAMHDVYDEYDDGDQDIDDDDLDYKPN